MNIENKKTLTATQKKNKYRALQYTTLGGEFLSVLTPFIIMGAINYEEWFTVEGGWKVGLGGALALALLGIAVFLVGKKKEDNSLTNGYIALILGWFMVAFIFVLLANIMDQIATIMFFGGIGLCGAFGLDMFSKNFKAKADAYKNAINKVKTEQMEDEYRTELGGKTKEDNSGVHF